MAPEQPTDSITTSNIALGTSPLNTDTRIVLVETGPNSQRRSPRHLRKVWQWIRAKTRQGLIVIYISGPFLYIISIAKKDEVSTAQTVAQVSLITWVSIAILLALISVEYLDKPSNRRATNDGHCGHSDAVIHRGNNLSGAERGSRSHIANVSGTGLAELGELSDPLKQTTAAMYDRTQQEKRSCLPRQHSRSRNISHDVPNDAKLMMSPETRPISQEQLVAEVKGIYAGLVMLESKCIEYDSSQEGSSLDKDHQYHALISLHRSLFHEHHDVFLASQHPVASNALHRFSSKYAMPARVWRHVIHLFLELLRGKLRASRKHMLSFIYMAYTMMALLYETVPASKDTWIECFGDLGRYRMAIEDDDIWKRVSRCWYTEASDTAPTMGRLYHHLAILARPNALQQLYFYAMSLCIKMPFIKARDSIMTLLYPLSKDALSTSLQLEPLDAAFLRVHGILIPGGDQVESSNKLFLHLLNQRIGRAHGDWLEVQYHAGISPSCLLCSFGDESNVLLCAISENNAEQLRSAVDEISEAGIDPSPSPKMVSLRDVETLSCPDGSPYLLPEDYAMRGLVYDKTYFPSSWFSNTVNEDDERYFELASTMHASTEKAVCQLWQRLKAEEQMCMVSVDRSRHGSRKTCKPPITLHGKTHHPLANTMASTNFMLKKYVTSTRAAIDQIRRLLYTFCGVIGKAFRTIDKTILEVSLYDGSCKEIWQTFTVVERCAAGLIMHDPWLSRSIDDDFVFQSGFVCLAYVKQRRLMEHLKFFNALDMLLGDDILHHLQYSNQLLAS